MGILNPLLFNYFPSQEKQALRPLPSARGTWGRGSILRLPGAPVCSQVHLEEKGEKMGLKRIKQALEQLWAPDSAKNW